MVNKEFDYVPQTGKGACRFMTGSSLCLYNIPCPNQTYEGATEKGGLIVPYCISMASEKGSFNPVHVRGNIELNLR